MFVHRSKAGLAPALKRTELVDTIRIDAFVALVGTFVLVDTGVSVASIPGLAQARVVGAQISALGIWVARMTQGAKVGTFTNHAALAMGLYPLVGCTI